MSATDAMPAPLAHPDRLVVAITARALFDLEDSHALFERSGVGAYAEFQRARENEVLAPGIAYWTRLVQRALPA